MKGGVLNIARLTTLVLSAACASARSTTASSPSPAEPVSRAESDRAAATPRAHGQRALSLHPADIHFMSGMIGHHAQAIVMAGWAPTHGASPRCRPGRPDHQRPAGRDRTMQRWLRDRRQPVPEADATRHEDDDERDGARRC